MKTSYVTASNDEKDDESLINWSYLVQKIKSLLTATDNSIAVRTLELSSRTSAHESRAEALPKIPKYQDKKNLQKSSTLESPRDTL